MSEVEKKQLDSETVAEQNGTTENVVDKKTTDAKKTKKKKPKKQAQASKLGDPYDAN